jgi:hypothetical protein
MTAGEDADSLYLAARGLPCPETERYCRSNRALQLKSKAGAFNVLVTTSNRMSNHLATYLHDHLAGSNFAIELLKNLQEQHGDGPLGQFAYALSREVEKDREALRGIIERVGAEAFGFEEAAGWVAEKLSRFKLRHMTSPEFGTYESLELLALGIQGKLALWRTLSVIAPPDARLRGIDYEALSTRAEAQHATVEDRRLEAAVAAFGGAQP